jgi:hypothetical protein
MSGFKKIVVKTLGTAVLASSMIALGAQAQTSAPANTGYISGMQILKNTAVGAVAGKLIGSITGGNSDMSAGIGLLAGVGKSIYENEQAKQAAEVAAAAEVKKAAKAVPVVDITAKQVMEAPQEKPEKNEQIQQKTEKLYAMSSASMESPSGKMPAPSIKKISEKGSTTKVEISGNSSQDLVFGVATLLRVKYGINVDILSSDAALLKQGALIKTPQSMVIDTESGNPQSSLIALKRLVTPLGMGVIFEDKVDKTNQEASVVSYGKEVKGNNGVKSAGSYKDGGYVFVANKDVVRSIIENPTMTAVSSKRGITTNDVSTFLATDFARKSSYASTGASQIKAAPVVPDDRLAHDGLARSQRALRN